MIGFHNCKLYKKNIKKNIKLSSENGKLNSNKSQEKRGEAMILDRKLFCRLTAATGISNFLKFPWEQWGPPHQDAYWKHGWN